MKKQTFIIFMICLVWFFPLFTIAQNSFQEVSEIPQGKAVIYVYRTSAYGFAVHYTVNADDKPIMKTHLGIGGYMFYFADPGKTEIWAETAGQRESVVVTAEAGQSYFVEGSVRSGTWVGRPYFEVIPREKAIKKISKTHLLVDNEDSGK